MAMKKKNVERAQEIGLCTKYFLFFSNVFFWAVALVLLGIGIWAWSEKGFFDNISYISSLPIDPVLVIIAIGSIMFFLTMAGCIGSLRENLLLLKCFSFSLGIFFFAELLVGILGFAYKDFFKNKFAVFVNQTIMDYREDPDLQNLIDFTQEYLMCCGGQRGPDDWENNIYFNCSSLIFINNNKYSPEESCGVPYSCCVRENLVINTQCGFGMRNTSIPLAERAEKIHTTGCISSFEDWLQVNLYSVAGVFIALALLQIIPFCFAYNLMTGIEAVKARWAKTHKVAAGDGLGVPKKILQMKPTKLGTITPSGVLVSRLEEGEDVMKPPCRHYTSQPDMLVSQGLQENLCQVRSVPNLVGSQNQ